ncbi:hypothetical protein [Rufibacter psychrotolerans]|uniref:hypothetical protein n=1 Tax=Rufibacter psychrotolerans TaxID=2812556 RepID=UPI0019675425|nr:hypothetical protein [Rufibacter sp. SYSU D00308]
MICFRTLVLSVAASALVGVTSCSVPQLRVSEAMTQEATVLPVVGRPAFRLSLGQEKGFGFGAYKLEDPQRGWTRKATYGEGSPLQVAEGLQKYSFGVRDTLRQQTWWVQAAARLNATTVQAAGWSVDLDRQREFLQVAFRSPESGEWRMALADPGNYLERKDFVGKISNGTQEIEVFPLYKWEGKSLPSGTVLGYEFSRGGHVLATVQTVNSGKVWMKNTLSPDLRQVLASACGALLLYNQLGQDNQ